MNKNGKKVTIIDYEIGNLFSVQNAFKNIGLESIITSDKDIIHKSDALILPGVGAFGNAMQNLEKLDLIYPIKDFIAQGKPFLGICLGLQLLFSESEEFGSVKGLGIIDGYVKRIPNFYNGKHIKVPQISWNQIFCKNQSWQGTELEGINEGEFMYFVHSFYVNPKNQDDILTITNYEGLEYCSSIKKDNIFACQFHPEKSGQEGMKIYENFKKIIKNKRY